MGIKELEGKKIKKLTWSNDGSSGIKVHMETECAYILTYCLGFKGDLIYLHTKDAG